MTCPGQAALLSVRDLEIRYGSATAVRGVSLQVNNGELVTIIGNNGAGKTSILRGICGLVKPASGSISVRGIDATGSPPHAMVRKGISMVPEGRMIFPDQTVEDNLILGAYTSEARSRAKVADGFERAFSLFPRLRERRTQIAGSLSGGEQQMLALARGLMARPALLIVDELSLGLAPKIVEQLIEVLRQLNKQGLSILLVEQLASFALAIANRAYVIANGRVEREGLAAVVAADPEIMETFLGKKRLTA
jgi:branched-chain amino acid transport system ATP-binding protein